MKEMPVFCHEPVLRKEVLAYLNINPKGIYLDGTLGGAGHSYEICKCLQDGGMLIGIDQDKDAILAATKKLEVFKEKVKIIHSNYSSFAEILKEQRISLVDGILLDLGVSSFQLDTKERGFSYREDSLLDMRMDDRNPVTAQDIVNDYEELKLYHVIKEYGEDKFAKNIAKHIVKAREQKRIETTFELVDIIKAAIPAKVREGTGHPAKRTFQAIRIELNKELEVLKKSLEEMIDYLKPGGRLCVITFHSLEDRIVKQCFRKQEIYCVCPPSFPVCNCGRRPKGKSVVRKAILPLDEEILLNKRAKSAKLRVFERTGF